jgi:LysM repeat protein
VNRLWATRLAAPAAFLLGITVALLLVRSGLDGNDATTTGAQTATPTTTQPTKGQTQTATQPQPAFVEVQSGDTLDQIALENDTTVEALLTLNQGLDPNALQVGQRVRVR